MNIKYPLLALNLTITTPISKKSKMSKDLRSGAVFLLFLKIPQPPPNLLAAEVPAGGPQWHKKKHGLSLLWHCEGKEETAVLPRIPLQQKCSSALGKAGQSMRFCSNGPCIIRYFMTPRPELEPQDISETYRWPKKQPRILC